MRDDVQCPSCDFTQVEQVHGFTLADTFKNPEISLEHTNNYRRNYILFENILNRSREEVEVKFLMCRNCGLIYFTPRPTEADLAIKYRLIQEDHDTERREETYALVDLRRDRAAAIARRVRPYLSHDSGNALDIGGADGHCLADFTDQFRCGVVDFESRKMWPNTERLGSTSTDLPSDYAADLIVNCHTLEHVDDVRKFLGDIRSRLSERGILYIEVPYGSDGEYAQTRNLLTHLNFFSKSSLSDLLSRVGFEVLDLAAGPVLSRKRYLPVISVVARRGAPMQTKAGAGYEGTRREMAETVNREVLVANAMLVMRHPIGYARAYLNRRTAR